MLNRRCLRSQPGGRERFFMSAGVVVPPRPGMEPDDLVTPASAASLLGVPLGTVRSWISRYGIEQLGTLGRWPAYDYNAIAAVDARLRRERESAHAA